MSSATERLKVKAKSGQDLPYVSYKDGSTQHATRITIATVFERDGKKGVKFEDAQRKAIAVSLGLPEDSELYFDLFSVDAMPAASPAPKSAPKAAPRPSNEW